MHLGNNLELKFENVLAQQCPKNNKKNILNNKFNEKKKRFFKADLIFNGKKFQEILSYCLNFFLKSSSSNKMNFINQQTSLYKVIMAS